MPAGSGCSVSRGPETFCLCPHVKLYRALKEVVLTAQIWGQEGARSQTLPADMKAHPSTPCSWCLSSTLPLLPTICTYIIWGSSGPNKSHVLITFEGVMTSGPQPIFIWFQSEGQRTGYASDTLQSCLSDSTCAPCFLCRCLISVALLHHIQHSLTTSLCLSFVDS